MNANANEGKITNFVIQSKELVGSTIDNKGRGSIKADQKSGLLENLQSILEGTKREPMCQI